MTPASDHPMTLQDRIESAMRDAMRARDERRTQTLRMAMSAAHNRQIELGRALTDDDYVDILSKQVKQRRESIEAFRSGGRDAMADNEEAEAAILAEFLPEALSPDELESLVRAAIAESGATSPADLGRVMGKVVPQTKGRADGKAVSDLVRQLLSA
jgi:uncharacterized protein